MTTSPVCVVVPTFRRADGLKRALESVFAQKGVPHFDVLVVDNDPSASARKTCEALQTNTPETLTLTYVHEPNPGVANARNRAMESTDCNLIAFLDDDQSVPENWLANLLTNHKQLPAAITFGPVVTALPDSVTQHKAYLETFFARPHEGPSEYIDAYYGCGNALLDRSKLPDISPLFDTKMNETGGEDDVLFSKVEANGGKFAWCSDAPAFEHVPEDRATLNYALKRAFAYGQGPITMARKQTPPRWDLVALWMLIGSFKAFANGLIYSVLWLVRAPNRAHYLDLAARGLGKMFWWRDMRFYGAARLEKIKAETPSIGGV